MDAKPLISRRLILLSFCALALIILFVWLVHYSTTGKIIVTTNNSSNSITLTKIIVTTSKNIPKTYKSQGKLNVTTSTGKYIVSVEGNIEGNSIASARIINLEARKIISLTINPTNTSAVESVAYQNAQNIAADNNQLIYFNKTTGRVEKVDAGNNLTLINSPYQFQAVKWANTSFGVGQDSNGHLYTISAGVISPLSVPFKYGDRVGFDVSPKMQIFVSNGADVYAGNQNGGFKKVYISSASKPVLAASVNQVAVADETEEQNASGASKPLLAIVGTSGKVIKKNIEAGNMVWSPNGQYLVSFSQSNLQIYDTSLNLNTTLPNSSLVGSAEWLDDNTLLYSVNDQLWNYNMLSQKAELVANMPAANPITGIAINSDKSYIYVTTTDTTGSRNVIRRIGLLGQKVGGFIYQLQNAMPMNFDNYSLSLINFSGAPAILVKPFPDSTVSAQADAQDAPSKLQQRGLDITNLQFIIAPSS